MSIGQLLLTAGVALWVFDAKKIPKLASDLASMVSIVQRYYQRALTLWAVWVQQAINQQTLAHNESKARQIEGNADKNTQN